jgi:hypothetical protein
MMRIGGNRALTRAAAMRAATNRHLAQSALPYASASFAAAAAPAAATAASSSSSVMHAVFRRLFSTNLSSGVHVAGGASSTPFPFGSGNVGGSFVGSQGPAGVQVGIPQATPVGVMNAGAVDAATASKSEHHLDNFDISPPIKAALRQNFKIEHLFPVQAECYKPIVDGKDLIGRSKTGQWASQTQHALCPPRPFFFSSFLPSSFPSPWPPITNFCSCP